MLIVQIGKMSVVFTVSSYHQRGTWRIFAYIVAGDPDNPRSHVSSTYIAIPPARLTQVSLGSSSTGSSNVRLFLLDLSVQLKFGPPPNSEQQELLSGDSSYSSRLCSCVFRLS